MAIFWICHYGVRPYWVLCCRKAKAWLTGSSYKYVFVQPSGSQMRAIAKLMDEEKLKIHIHKKFKFEDARCFVLPLKRPAHALQFIIPHTVPKLSACSPDSGTAEFCPVLACSLQAQHIQATWQIAQRMQSTSRCIEGVLVAAVRLIGRWSRGMLLGRSASQCQHRSRLDEHDS